MGGSSAPTPLYPVYQAMWGFSPITLTVAFAVYALALLAALLTVGALSDHLGRRPVLLAALLVEVVAMVVFAVADSATALIAARVVQGLATGAALGSLGAYLIELEPRNRPGLGTVINSAGPILGLAVGAVASSIIITIAPGSIHAVYVVILGLLVLQIVGTAITPETVRPAPGALASLRPRVHLPQSARRAAMWVLPAAVSTWALGGLILSLGPIVVRSMAGSGSAMLGGLIVAALAGTGGVAVLLVGSWAPRRLLTLGMVTLLIGMATTMIAVGVGSLPLYFAATVVAGVGFGAGFLGVLRTLMPLAAAHERAGLLSAIYVVSYLAMSVPAVVAGRLVTVVGLNSTLLGYAAAIMVLVVFVLAGLLRTPRSAADRGLSSDKIRRSTPNHVPAPRRADTGSADINIRDGTDAIELRPLGRGPMDTDRITAPGTE